jgi:F0F1-type ATP synthase assembly protein I
VEDRSNNRVRRPQQDSKNFLERATESFQEDVTRAAPTAAVSYTLIGAIMVCGLIGYGIDRWRGGSSHVFLVVGLILGIVVGFVDLARFVWKK